MCFHRILILFRNWLIWALHLLTLYNRKPCKDSSKINVWIPQNRITAQRFKNKDVSVFSILLNVYFFHVCFYIVREQLNSLFHVVHPDSCARSPKRDYMDKVNGTTEEILAACLRRVVLFLHTDSIFPFLAKNPWPTRSSADEQISTLAQLKTSFIS